MTIQITPEEDRAALDELIRELRHLLAKNRHMVRLHRDIYNSPAEQVAALEADGAKYLMALEDLERQRAALDERALPHLNGKHA